MSGRNVEKPLAAYAGSEPYVFVCHAHVDEAIVYPEMRWLQEQGIKLWYDAGISGGTVWRDESADAIRGATKLLVYLSQASVTSPHCLREIDYALDHGVNVLPVYVDDVKLQSGVDLALSRVQALHRSNTPEYRSQLLAALGRTGSAAPSPPRGQAPRSRRSRSIALIAAFAIVLAGLGIWTTWPRLVGPGLEVASVIPPTNLSLPDKPSIAVLPFTNMSGDPDQEYFADGITEDLTTALSQTSTLFVIARNSAFTYKGRAVKIEDVGRELGVRYVLEGSVRRAGDKVRITAQLSDAATGFHVWGEHYDRDLVDVFAVQSEIAEQVFVATGAPILEAELERIRRKPTESLTAYDAFTKGLYLFGRFRVRDMAEARRWFERAVELDPGYAEAFTGLGTTYSLPYGWLWTLDESALDRADAYFERAIELDPRLSDTYFSRGAVLLFRGRTEEGLHAIERARELAPNEWRPYMMIAIYQAQAGDLVAARDSFQRSLRLNPRTTSDAEYMQIMANIYQRTGREDEAVRIEEQLRAENPDAIWARLALAVHYRAAGQHDEAHTVIQEALQVNPALSVEALSRRWVGAADLEERLRNLRAAGLP